MSFQRQVSRVLDDEHRANLEILGRVERALLGRPERRSRATPSFRSSPVRSAGSSNRISSGISTSRSASSSRGMEEAGDGDMAMLLAEEHKAIRAVATSSCRWRAPRPRGRSTMQVGSVLKRGALEMVERQVAHIQKETMALLPLLEDLLDEDDDGGLALAYVSG